MPARSKAQQKMAGAELSRRRKGKRPRAMLGMSRDELEKYASTPRKGLPARKKKRT